MNEELRITTGRGSHAPLAQVCYHAPSISLFANSPSYTSPLDAFRTPLPCLCPLLQKISEVISINKQGGPKKRKPRSPSFLTHNFQCKPIHQLGLPCHGLLVYHQWMDPNTWSHPWMCTHHNHWPFHFRICPCIGSRLWLYRYQILKQTTTQWLFKALSIEILFVIALINIVPSAFPLVNSPKYDPPSGYFIWPIPSCIVFWWAFQAVTQATLSKH